MRNDRAGDRTQDLRIKSPLLYQLSYPVVLKAKLTRRRDLDKRIAPLQEALERARLMAVDVLQDEAHRRAVAAVSG